MSVQSWLNDHYPIPASGVPKKDATAHSLQKWQGLRLTVLQKHGLMTPPIAVNGYTCALCVHYLESDEHGLDSCTDCPLYRVRGNVRCDRRRRGENISPFGAYRNDSNPEPMIEWLEKAATWEK